jgi:116 kDa U5 small nuclear ribonucleoprotein component
VRILYSLYVLMDILTPVSSPDNTYSLSIDNGKPSTGSLLTDFNPPVNPPNEIDDPADSKPDDWVDTKRIPDPDATKVHTSHSLPTLCNLTFCSA